MKAQIASELYKPLQMLGAKCDLLGPLRRPLGSRRRSGGVSARPADQGGMGG
jgi:hypothetical protein